MAAAPGLAASRARLAATDPEAARRFAGYRSSDPFPDVPPALLNSADVTDYVVETGMVHPFDPEAAKLKPASYAVPLLGKVVWWVPDEYSPHVMDLTRGKRFKLRPNAIAFVTLEPMFRLPDYIALRFNLKIKNVYRGLLLGTGPLVDPGFEGRLSFPLHNLTTNEYRFKGGEDVIWVEFTKISPNERWDSRVSRPGRVGVYMPFEKPTRDHDVESYIEDAVGQQHVVSSISEALAEARSARKWTVGGAAVGIVAAIALIAGVVTLIVSIFAMRDNLPSRSEFDNQRVQIQKLQSNVSGLQAALHAQARHSATKKP